jgi:uncharacterized protein involved in response to NO
MATLLHIEDGDPRPPARPFALWALGFRPLYLGAGLFAALSIAAWTASFGTGWLAGAPALHDPLWHAHEMIFGFAFAVIVGFLFTAVRNWTGQPTPAGAPLAATVALWLAARLLLFSPWPLAAAAADAAFALAAAWGIGVPLYRSGNRRNAFFVALLVAFGAANVAFHLAMAGFFDLPARRFTQLGLDLVLFVMVVMGGRVIPMFTANARQVRVRRLAWLEPVALGSVLALLGASLADLPPAAVAACAALAAVANAARISFWRPWATLRHPILWILHASYAWIVAHLALRALAALDLAGASAATHALTVGAIGGLILGMMTRTARGHTGRPLKASAPETAAFVLIQLAAAVRVFLPLAAPAAALLAIQLSGALWTAAFGLFVVKFWPVLTRARIDGRPG